MAPVTWPVDYPDDCSALTTGNRALFTEAAVDYLWQVTHRRFGTFTEVLRPCRPEFSASNRRVRLWQWQWNTMLNRDGSGHRVPLSCACLSLRSESLLGVGCTPGRGCQCTQDTATSLLLPGPASNVTSVLLDGTPFTDWRLDGDALIRSDGQWWPATQDLAADPTDPESGASTLQVTYTRGTPVPVGGQIAAGALACELAKAHAGDASCKLPQRIQTITRQGVTIGFVDDFKNLAEGNTGIWVIDAWVASINGSRIDHVSVKSPDYC